MQAAQVPQPQAVEDGGPLPPRARGHGAGEDGRGAGVCRGQFSPVACWLAAAGACWGVPWWWRVRRPVETNPDGAGAVVAVDTPIGGECMDDVQSVSPAGFGGGWGPEAALIFDFDPDVVAGAEFRADGELADRKSVVTVQGGVRGHLGSAQDGVVSDGTAVE